MTGRLPGWGLAAALAVALALLAAVNVAAQGAPPRLEGVGVHIVRPGETLFTIARRYHLTVAELASLNGTDRRGILWPGRQLLVPLARAINARADAPAPVSTGEIRPDVLAGQGQENTPAELPAGQEPGAAPAEVRQEASAAQEQQEPFAAESPAVALAAEDASPPSAYTVVPGDTLYGISRRFGVSVEDLKRWNGLPPDGSIWAGERLALTGPPVPSQPAPVAAPARYTVQPGDTLSAIARRYGTTVAALKAANGLTGDGIRAGQVLVVAGAGMAPGAQGGAKRIEVDISEQRMYVYQGNTLLWRFVVSTGMAGYPTRRGTFAVQSKIPNAWSSAWQLWMPHWLGIYWAGSTENGIHALPIINGRRLWGGVLGTPVSYGCIVLGTQEAELLYNWAEMGTPVIIRD